MDKNLSRDLFEKFKENTLFGRYITTENLYPILDNFSEKIAIETIGKSVNDVEIKSIQIGSGNKKVLMWSQMHGNESTTTKAIFDLLNTLVSSDEEMVLTILSKCTLCIVPILNPDGARAYIRFNANNVDLNRDALNLSQPESRALRTVFESFKPDYCFNLHGQRTIFSAGDLARSATVSFLSPAQDDDKTLTTNRKIAMALIAEINGSLQNIIPGSVGVYDDSFNLNCVGDYFQSQGVPTVLFEAGHYKNDYQREYTRYLIYHSYLVAFSSIASDVVKEENFSAYSNIPENKKLFFDIIIRNALTKIDKTEKVVDVAFQYEEILENGKIIFRPKIEKIGNLETYFGHKEFQFEGEKISLERDEELKVGNAIDFVNKNNERLSLKLEDY